MSLSPERMSSYRRHFQGDMSSSSLQVRVSNLSPPRKPVRQRSASYTRRSFSKPRMTSSVSMRALCFGVNLDLDAAAAESQAFLSTRSNERQEMMALNDRLASYIEKVRTLEQQNMLLEAEIDALKSRFMKPSGLRQLYEAQLRDLKRTAEQMRVQRGLALAAKEAMSGQLEVLKVKYEEALEARKKAEMEVTAFRPDVDRATSAHITLEKQLENLEGELEFLQRVHKEEIDELMERIFSSVAKVDVNFALPDLSSALKQIQSQYNSIAAKNLQEMDVWYKSKFHDLTDRSTKHALSIRSVRQEIAGYKKDILNRERDLESLRTRNESLDSQIRDAVEKFKREEEMLQERIEAVKLELKVTKEKIALLLKEHQELLNVKMVLEIEITTYRKLLEGEDSRLNGMIQSLSLDAGGKGAVTISTSSASLAVGSAPDVAGSTPDVPGSTPDVPSPAMLAMGMMSKDDLSGVPGNGSDVTVEVMSSESQTESYAEELTERKTVLRTVKTDEDIEEKDSQEQNITISGDAHED